MALMIIQKASYMTLKMIQKVAYDPEDDSESRLWPWRLFRKPTMTLKIIQKAAFDKSVLEVFPHKWGVDTGKINQDREENCV